VVFETKAYLNSNDGSGILAFGEQSRCVLGVSDDVQKMEAFLNKNNSEYIFVCLSYDLKNRFYPLVSDKLDSVNFPEAIFWVPEYVVKINREEITFLKGDRNSENLAFLSAFLEEETDRNFHNYQIDFQPRIDFKTYIEKVNRLKKHIQRGDIYEVNFCQEFFAENCIIDFPMDAFFKMNEVTQAPFSAYVQFDEFSVFCGSPERFLKKEGDRLITQPIKGTAPRGSNEKEDEVIKEELRNNPKERSENIMIVDLVRNDLSQVAAKGSVKVDELCVIYSFETVHQMISTVSCELREDVSFIDILKATFPMGSMTGAPKKRAMEIIEEYESFKRGLYSGTIGYISPNGDFDLNVVIRTLLYNADKKYLSCSVGSAITFESVPEMEFEECKTKIEKIFKALHA
jgi:para-aminobenzoate synthetase component 1